jgi:glycosyltransferase involved in cell wall biosynthesis
MKIVIDARMYGLEHAGIGRYVSNLIREISYTPHAIRQHQFILLVRKSKLDEVRKEIGKKVRMVVADYPHYSLQEQIALPLALAKLKPDLVHFPHFNVPVLWWGKQVVTIHDLIKHESRGKETTTRLTPFYWFKYLNYRFLVWLAVKRATRVIVPSNYWKKELVQKFKLKPDKIVVTYEGVSDKFKPLAISHKLSAEILLKYKISRPFIIYTGNLYPHKNVERLVQAIKLVNSEQWSVVRKKSPITNHQSPITLVVSCSRNIFHERFKKKVEEMRAEKYVNLVGFVPDEELVALYQEAEAFVLPTLLEGFGLIGLEAMATGLPVVCSDIPVLREIYQDAAIYFDPLDVDDMAEKIKRIIGSGEQRNKLKKQGLELVERYSWQKMAKQTLKVYKEVMGSEK